MGWVTLSKTMGYDMDISCKKHKEKLLREKTP